MERSSLFGQQLDGGHAGLLTGVDVHREGLLEARHLIAQADGVTSRWQAHLVKEGVVPFLLAIDEELCRE